jgi:hypothetical protein
MKAYALDLRERVVKFVNDGGSKVEAARRFELARSSVYRYLDAVEAGTLAPKASWGHWRKLDPHKLQSHVKKHPGATLRSASMFIFCRCSCANFFPDGEGAFKGVVVLPVREIRDVIFPDFFRQSFAGVRVRALLFFNLAEF